MATLNPTSNINYCRTGTWSECSEKGSHSNQKNCYYYKIGATNCNCLRFEVHCDSWDAQHKVKENE